MKQLSTIFLFLSFIYFAQAQQSAQYSLYMFNPMAWNPAYVGLDNSLSITGVFRKQWTNLAGSPTTQNLSAQMPLYMLSGGVGINVENDALGAQRLTSASLAYAFHKELGGGFLSFGVSGGIVQRLLDGSRIRTPDGQYIEPGNFNHNDLLLPLSGETANVPTFHAGVYFANDWLDAGFSVRNITEPATDFSTVNLQLNRAFNFNLGFHFDVFENFSLHPFALVRSDLKQTQTDFSVILRYNDNIFGGASLRGYNSNTLDAVALLAGFKLNENWTLAYAYDLTMSDLNTVSNGSHEISLNYNLNKIIGKGRPPKIIYNPRSL
ncbi:MAG: type IX secretion system membrane protein PorP/SprF [Saprospiraceae bacterium]